MKALLIGLLVLATGCDNFELLKQLKPRMVTVLAKDIAHAKDGTEVEVPLPAAGEPPCEIWVDAILNAGWHKYEGKWVADGVCEVHDVLPGETLVRVPRRDVWVTTTLDEVDLGIDYSGRKVERAGKGTTLTLDLQGAAPLSINTVLQSHLYDFGEGVSNVFGSGSGGIGTPMGMDGATSFPVTIKWDDLPLLKTGESLLVFQGKTQQVGSDFLQFTLVKSGVADVLPTSGKNVRAAVAMTDIATRATPFPAVPFDPKALYARIKADVPAPRFLGAILEQSAAAPGAFSNVPLQTSFTIDESLSFNAPATSVDPFPGVPWNQRVSMAVFFDSSIGDGAVGAYSVANVMNGPANDLAWLQSTALTPVRNIKAKVGDFDPVSVGDVGAAAFTLTWDVPLVGLPNTYVVLPIEVTLATVKDENGQDKDILEFTRTPQSFRVSRPEAHIPPEMLKNGSNYIFSIIAENCTAADAQRPRRLKLQSTCGSAENRSFLLTTP